MRGIIERSREMYNFRGDGHAKDSYNESLHIWRLTDGRMIEFGSMQNEHDREAYRGRPHDLKCWDELSEFSESQYRFVNAWNRSTRCWVEVNGEKIIIPPTDDETATHEGREYPVCRQRCRVVATCNPPTTVEGRWIIKYWAPWLDDKHPNPARVGELRWFASIEGKDVEVDSGAPFEHEGETVYPRSRTFIPALLSDNPALEKTGYRATLQGLPEPLRSQMLKGDFKAGIKDSAWQVIPTAWVDAAIARGKAKPVPDVPLTALGVDPSRGGDEFVIAPRHGNWFGPLVKHTSASLEVIEIDGPIGAKIVADEARDGCVINIDVTGIGSAPYDELKDLPGYTVNPINNAGAAKEFDARGTEQPMFDETGKFKLTNVRTAGYWKLREALAPGSGQEICLPDDDMLRADLTAPTYKVTAAGYVVEPKGGKGSISERLGRSPDAGDAVVLAHWEVPKVPAFELILV